MKSPNQLLLKLGAAWLLFADCSAIAKIPNQPAHPKAVTGLNAKEVVCQDSKGAKTIFTELSSTRWELQFEGQSIKHPLHVYTKDDWSIYLWSNRGLATEKQWIAETQLDLFQRKCYFAANLQRLDALDFSALSQHPQNVTNLVSAE